MAFPITFNLTSTGVGKASNAIPSILVFGTEGLYTGVIVKSATSTPIISEVQVPNGSGQTVASIVINDGDEMQITVDDDRAVTWPVSGNTVSLYNPQPNGAGATLELFQVYNNNYNLQAKAVGERTLIVKKYFLITPTAM
jgi:hypothetical protein